jgi:hypothetical protein
VSVQHFVDFGDVKEVQFACTICKEPATKLPLNGITVAEIFRIVNYHCHLGRGSNPSGANEAVGKIAKFLTEDMKVFADTVNSRNLEIKFLETEGIETA